MTFEIKHAWVTPDRPIPHDIDGETRHGYRRVLGAALASRKLPDARYLTKHNNAMQRPEGVAEGLPNALLVIPQRVDQAVRAGTPIVLQNRR
ncbi:MAG: hypothetical protein AAF899_04190 [Pseudomonadota bacterium]